MHPTEENPAADKPRHGLPELLAPAGDRLCARAAVENGADAVYFGLATATSFNARARAKNVTPEELPELLAWLHRRGVKGYVAVNTLVFPGELEEVEKLLRQIAEAGADAVIVQDLGVARLARELCPELPLHASTQMTLSSAEAIGMVEPLGIRRVILPRELSISEIRRIRAATGLELEVFVHGALCLAYSGQCLASRTLGGRSSNRGDCAQPCRLPYQVDEKGTGAYIGSIRKYGQNDSQRKSTQSSQTTQYMRLSPFPGGQKYPLSTQDLAAYDLVPELIGAGVSALKIEGRLKTAEYVAAVTRHYRRAIDAACSDVAGGGGRGASRDGEKEKGRRGEEASKTGNDSSSADSNVQTTLPVSPSPLLPFSASPPTPQDLDQLALTFSRGFCRGWLQGPNHKALVSGRTPGSRGVLLGEVKGVGRRGVVVKLASAVQRGDGIVFESDTADDARQGGRVYEVFVNGRSLTDPVAAGEAELTFAHGAIDPNKIRPGQEVRKTDDPRWERQLRRTFDGDPQRHLALDLVVEAAVGQPLRIAGSTASGATCKIESPEPLEEARKHPLTEEVLRAQLGRLGNTAYELRHLDAQIEGRPMVPLSVLGQLRHAMVEQLNLAAAQSPARPLAAGSAVARLREEEKGTGAYSGHIGKHGKNDSQRESTQSSQITQYMRLSPFPPGRATAELHVLCRSMEQIGPVLGCGVRSVLVDFPDVRRCREAVETIRQAGARVFLATPRIQKPGEERVFRTLAGFGPDGLLVRNLGGLGFCRGEGIPAVADSSLNAANELTVHWLHQQGALRVTAAYDLDRGQIADLAATVPPEWLEVVVYQHVPMFHTEHCIFCAVLSSGTDRTNCGQPCRRHEVRLRDPAGMEHPVAAEYGCRNTVYSAAAQESAELVPALLQRGVGHFRVEFLEGTGPHEVEHVVRRYRRLTDCPSQP